MSVPDSDFVSPRLALVGASSLLGKEIKEQLAATGFPGTDVALFDLEEVAGLLTDYGDEARVLADTVAEQVLDHDLVCFCGDRETARDYLAQLLAAGRRGLDCTGAWLDDDKAFAWIPGVSEPPVGSDNRAVAIPLATTLLVGRTMAALGDLGGGATANVFVPASDLGDAGLKELSQQATAVMNLIEVDDDVFGRQMAFDIWLPPIDAPAGVDHLVGTLSRLGIDAPALNVIAAPVFHGLAMSMFVPGAAADDVAASLSKAGFNVAAGEGPQAANSVAEGAEAGDSVAEGADVDGSVAAGADIDGSASPVRLIDSPLRAVGTAGIHAIKVRDDAAGSWVWAVADNLDARAAAAVAAILALSGNTVSDALQ